MFCSVSTLMFHPWSAASVSERLRPRGGPRQSAVVGQPVPRQREDHCFCGRRDDDSPSRADKPLSRIGLRRQKRWMTTARTAFFCRPPVPACSLNAEERGREQPPAFRPMPSRGRPGGLLTPPRAVVKARRYRDAYRRESVRESHMHCIAYRFAHRTPDPRAMTSAFERLGAIFCRCHHAPDC
jgi:hypothetical protein